MRTNTIILMTALLPTTGHTDLIKWASLIPDNDVYVLVSARTFEPVPGILRKAALESSLSGVDNVVVKLHEDDEAPQNPTDHYDFWRWWKTTINNHFPELSGKWDYVVASEPYGQEIAESLNSHFMPYDIKRELNPIKSTKARLNPEENWGQIIDLIRQSYQTCITIFGQESVGKTTLSRILARELSGTWLPEWARPYLETVGPNLNTEVMNRIYKGQTALQTKTFHDASKPFTILDTDLYSTVGYYQIGGYERNYNLEAKANELKSDLYFLLPDDVPFEEDILRYGGDIRESTYDFWKELLDNHSLEYQEVPVGSLDEKVSFMVKESKKFQETKWEKIKSFVRE